MSEDISKLEQKLQEKINKNTPAKSSSNSAKSKTINADHVRALAKRIRETLTDQDYATSHQ